MRASSRPAKQLWHTYTMLQQRVACDERGGVAFVLLHTKRSCSCQRRTNIFQYDAVRDSRTLLASLVCICRVKQVSGHSIACGPLPQLSKTEQARLCFTLRFAQRDGHQPYLFFSLPFSCRPTRGGMCGILPSLPPSENTPRRTFWFCSCWFPARYSRLKQARAAPRPLCPWYPWQL